MRGTEPQVGRLDKRVLIRRRTDIPTFESEIDSEYSETQERWASIVPVGAATYAGSVQIEERVTHRIYLRFVEGITTDFEIVHGTVTYRVRRSQPLNGAIRFTMIEVEELGDG